MPRRIASPKHVQTRSFLRLIGPLILLTGIVLTLIGMASFFMAFGSFSPPRFFWCAFLGLPLIVIGAGICQFAFMGAVTRYVAGEVTPVGKDVFNDVAHGTKDAVRDLAAAVGSGLREGAPPAEVATRACPTCGEANDAHANFCDNCGERLPGEIVCQQCSQPNDPDARFCDNCGAPLQP